MKTPLAAAKITIKMDDGAEIELGGAANAGSGLSNKAREEARAKLLGLQAQLNQLMQTLK
jgi:hypothetical protein